VEALPRTPSSRTNPFDRGPGADPLLEIVIDSDIDLGTTEAQRLLALSRFPFLSVVALPPNKTGSDAILRQKGIPLARYDEANRWHIVQTAKSSWLLLETDILVTGNSRLSSGPIAFWQAGPLEALELVRLFLVDRGIFQVLPGYSVDDTLYYIYRRWKLFPALYQPSAIAAYLTSVNFPPLVRDQLGSMGFRQQYLCRAADLARGEALRQSTYRSGAISFYHVAFFVLLSTGLFDDLAWLVRYLYNLQQLKREQIDLRKKAFRNALRKANGPLAAYLERVEVDNVLCFLYEIRHQLQHRAFPRLVSYEGPQLRGYFFELPAEAVRTVDGLGRDRCEAWGITSVR
jgi:hypothetical protein